MTVDQDPVRVRPTRLGQDRVPANRRFAGTRSAAGVALLAVLGTLIGGAAAATTSIYAASALVQAAPVDLGGVDQSDASSPQVRSELLYASLYSSGMNQAAATASGLENPAPVSVVLQTGTTILFFNARGPTVQDAVEIANSSAEYYVSEWRRRTVSAIERSIAILDTQISTLPQDSVDSVNLVTQRVDLQTQLAAVESADRIVSVATAESASRSVSIVGAGILGALGGVVIGTAILLRKRRHTVMAPGSPGTKGSGL